MRVSVSRKTDKSRTNEKLFVEFSESDEEIEQTVLKSSLSGCDIKQEADTEVISCYCSASHTDNISTDEHDSLRDLHINHSTTKGLQSSDSGTDLNECIKHDNNLTWHKYWSLNGETIIWKSWIARYSAYINPEYLEDNTSQENSNENPSKKSDQCNSRFSFEDKDIENVVNQGDINLITIDENAALLQRSGTCKKQEIASKNRMLIRNLSGSDSYDKLHTDVSEGWNPLSPASVEFEAEAERLLNSRCGSHASSSFRTQDSMTNVTHMTVSSIDLSSKSSDSFSSVSSVQSSLSLSSSEEIDDTGDFDQQWNQLWQKHYEEEYLVQYRKFMCSTGDIPAELSDAKLIRQDKPLCGDCHLIASEELGTIENILTSFNMEDNLKLETVTEQENIMQSSYENLELDPSKTEMLSMGLPISFGYDSASNKNKKSLKRSHEESEEDEMSTSNKIKSTMTTLFGMEYINANKNLTGRIVFKKKNIRLQNRQLTLLNPSKKISKPSHIYFDDDGNVIQDSNEDSNTQVLSSDSSDQIQTLSSGEEEVGDQGQVIPETIEINDEVPKKRKRKRKLLLPAEVKDNRKLLKFWYKRYTLFSKYDMGIKLDEESWYSVTPEAIAKETAQRCKCDLIIDAFCGAGGNAIQFASTCRKVIAIDIDPIKIQLARHNAEIYGVSDKIEFIVGNFLEIGQRFVADVVFLSPPWGGMAYLNKKHYDPELHLKPVPFSELYKYTKKITPNIAVFLPKTTNVGLLIEAADDKIEIEQNFIGRNLKAITAYYNELVNKL